MAETIMEDRHPESAARVHDVATRAHDFAEAAWNRLGLEFGASGFRDSIDDLTDPTARFPPGFDVYLRLIDAVPLDPDRMRSGIRADYVDAIVSAGDERWDAFLASWNAALRFV